MAVERVDYSSDEEFQQALQHEEMESMQVQYQEQEIECYLCGSLMEQNHHNPKYNICCGCFNEILPHQKINNEIIKVEDLPF